MAQPVFIGIDIGGTWLKAVAFTSEELTIAKQGTYPDELREPSGLGALDAQAFGERVVQLVEKVANGRKVAGIGFSSPGLVDPSGSRVTLCAHHLKPLADPAWLALVEAHFDAPCALMNDAQAGLCGAAEVGLIPALGTTGFLPLGTGLGFVIAKNGKLWNPGRMLPLLGSIRIPGGSFDSVASVTRLAAGHASGTLTGFLTDPDCAAERNTYFDDLKGIIATAAILYQLDALVLAGGLAGAAAAVNFSLVDAIAAAKGDFPELKRFPQIIHATAGNQLNLIGAAALAAGQSVVAPMKGLDAAAIPTEAPLQHGLKLETLSATELLTLLQKEEYAAAERLGTSLTGAAELVDEIAAKMEKGGRIIYVGAGTSGRLAALDAVELPCTFGCGRADAIALIAGGSPEASESIEEDGEEDFSAVPDMLIVQPTPLDTVIGISASGSSHFVLSALAFASDRGARTVMIKEAATPARHAQSQVIPLLSGPEIVQGSTRMKAGTATKRVLNALTTSVMIRRGKVRGSSMIDVVCLNEKLRHRAVRILGDLHGFEPEKSRALLEAADWKLRVVLDRLENASA